MKHRCEECGNVCAYCSDPTVSVVAAKRKKKEKNHVPKPHDLKRVDKVLCRIQEGTGTALMLIPAIDKWEQYRIDDWYERVRKWQKSKGLDK